MGVTGRWEKSALITPHALYEELGRKEEERRQADRALFRYELDPGEIDTIRKATNNNFACGYSRFSEEIAEMLGRCVVPGKAG